MLKNVVTILFIIVSVLITIIILMQQGKDAGLGSISGQVSDTYCARNKGRSKEGILGRLTAVLVVLFFLFAAILNIGSF
jgi:preprotein translocase subunit SecG